MDFDSFKWLTFDCYGTLIDWESGILSCLRPILASHRAVRSDQEILALFAELEAELESGTRQYIPYREVLARVVAGIGEKLGFVATAGETALLAASVPQWKPFPETVPALRRLKQKYKLGIISNIDDDLFASTQKQLEINFDLIITAQQARSYKPSQNNFLLAIRRIGVPKEKILHVAQSMYHDVIPSRALGIANVWVNRRSRHKGSGATKIAMGTPDLEVPDLITLAGLAC